MPDARKPVKRAYMSIDEVAEYFGVNPRTVRRLMSKAGPDKLGAIRVGRQWRIPMAEIERLEKRTSTKRWG